MPIDFVPSARGSLGLEWELALVDLDTRQLASRAPEVLAAVGAREDGPVRGEYLATMVELVTGVHPDVAGAVAELAEHLGAVQAAAADLGLGVYSAGTHPLTRGEDVAITPSPHYDVVRRRNGWWGRRMLICGTHVHVGVPARDLALPLVHGLAQLSPLVMALASSSPFFEGEDTGFASQRTMLFQQLPTNGLPPAVHTWDAFEAYYDELHAARMISRPSEIRWDVRPAPKFGTVEARVADASPTLGELACVAAWSQCLTEYLIRRLLAGDPLPGLSPWFVRENKWRAARYGLDAELITPDGLVGVRELIGAWQSLLAPIADDLGCSAELESAETILTLGTSAERQRAVAAASGGRLKAVVDAVLAETRGSL